MNSVQSPKNVQAGPGLVGLIRHQDEIYVSAEGHGYVALTASPQDENEQQIRIHVSNVDALIEMLVQFKRMARENWE